MSDAELFAAVFTDARPCSNCPADGLTFSDRETGKAYCLACLERAVDAAELQAERIDPARMSASFQCLSRCWTPFDSLNSV